MHDIANAIELVGLYAFFSLIVWCKHRERMRGK